MFMLCYQIKEKLRIITYLKNDTIIEEKDSQDDSVVVSIKFDGLTDRIMPVSKENGHFSRLQAGMSGKLFYLSRYNNASGSSKTD